MKKIIIAAFIATATLVSFNTETQAQVNVNVNVGRPAWLQPNMGNNYVYMPDINGYYYIPTGYYYFYQSNRWVGYRTLPRQYGRYNLRTMRQVPLAGRNVYLSNARHRNMYAQQPRPNRNNNGNHYGNDRNHGNGYNHRH